MHLDWCIPNVLFVLCIVCDWDGISMVQSLSFVHGSRECRGRMKFFIYDGVGISEWYEIIAFSPRKS